MIRAVLDTNVLISAVLSPTGPPSQLVEAWEANQFVLITSNALLGELRRTLGYGHLRAMHRHDDASLDAIVDRFRSYAMVVEPITPVHLIVDDPTDNAVLECALAGSAHYIVSGDRHLLRHDAFQGIPILRPVEFQMVVVEGSLGTPNGST